MADEPLPFDIAFRLNAKGIGVYFVVAIHLPDFSTNQELVTGNVEDIKGELVLLNVPCTHLGIDQFPALFCRDSEPLNRRAWRNRDNNR